MNPEQINTLSDRLGERVDDLVNSLQLALHEAGNKYEGCCPIHGGDNVTAFNLWREGRAPGVWRCYTRRCHETFGRTPVGLFRGVLSRREYNWAQPGDRTASLTHAASEAMKFLGLQALPGAVKPGGDERSFGRAISYLTATVNHKAGIPLQALLSKLNIPSPYFLKRGFHPDTLLRFGVGDALQSGKQLSDRAVAPIIQNGFAVGFTGRTLCDSPIKWKHVGFHAEEVLYNLAGALPAVRETGEIILTEGPADVWRLYEAGIENAVALLGDSLTDRKVVLLEQSGALLVTTLLDGDEAGRLASQAIHKTLRRSFRLRDIALPDGQDPADLSPDTLKRLLSC